LGEPFGTVNFDLLDVLREQWRRVRLHGEREVIYRHSGTVRITHWINVLVLSCS